MKPILSLDPELSLHVHYGRDSWINLYVFSLVGKCHLMCVTDSFFSFSSFIEIYLTYSTVYI